MLVPAKVPRYCYSELGLDDIPLARVTFTGVVLLNTTSSVFVLLTIMLMFPRLVSCVVSEASTFSFSAAVLSSVIGTYESSAFDVM